MKQPHVTTVILNWNGKDDTLACLHSLQETDYANHSIVVVDNASHDDSVDAIKKAYPHTTVLTNTENLGFSGGNNVGIAWALEHNADYCFVLNNDTLVEKDTISHLVSIAEKDASIGIVGPLILYMEPKHTIAALGGEIRWKKAEAIQGYNLVPEKEAPTEPFKTSFLTAAAILVRAEAIRKAGTLPEEYFYGMEDAAWCEHIKRAGFTLIADPLVKIHHKESAATGKSSPLKMYYTSRNALIFLKQESGKHYITNLMSYHIKVVKLTIKYLLTGQWRLLIAFWQGYGAFWLGKVGKK